MKTNAILDLLPSELKEEVLNVLTAFDKVVIDFENGKYIIGSFSIKDKYADDFKHVGIINNLDVYTDEEMKENYKKL